MENFYHNFCAKLEEAFLNYTKTNGHEPTEITMNINDFEKIEKVWKKHKPNTYFSILGLKVKLSIYIEPETFIMTRVKPEKMKKFKNPYTEKENKINELLVEAHGLFTELETMHPDDTREWVDGIHKCQNVLMRRVVIRDYPNMFYNASSENQVSKTKPNNDIFKRKSGWYKNNKYPLLLAYHNFDNNISYGFDVRDKWFFNTEYQEYDDSDYPANIKEVEERLIEEATKKGFIEGAKHNHFTRHKKDTHHCKGVIRMGYESKIYPDNKNTLYFTQGTGLIFKDGQWAEIVEDL